ncbi:MAG: hypothetical protein CVU44_15495 [Chloroflexi bacterium HGW-Chloroflexi-6]|nr:MAG: hypothetical protein CVU44_15495 [Chloroflexi bacterium HGW-Chloroflexi-6]
MLHTQISLLVTSLVRRVRNDLPLLVHTPPVWNEKSPFVSVIIPCYNFGHVVSEAVDSVLNQTWQDLEIIIVNDGSTDKETIKTLSAFQRPKTRILNLPQNIGLPAARNTGILEARGKYICCLDADDKLQETYIEKAITVMEINSGISFVWPWTKVFGSEDRVWYTPQFDPYQILFYNQLNSSAVFKKSAWQHAGGFNENMRDGFEDWEFWIRLTGHSFRGYRISEKLFFCRRVGYSFANRAADNKDVLFEQIRSNNANLYINPKLTMETIKRSYRDSYNPTPFLNIHEREYKEIQGLDRIIISSLNTQDTLSWLRRNPMSQPFLWISKKALDEKTTDALYAITPYVYILPNFMPEYARHEFIISLHDKFQVPITKV